jgi:hypothetical protein
LPHIFEDSFAMTDTASLCRRELLKKIAATGLVHSCGMLGIVQQALAANLLDIKQGMISTSGKVTVDGYLAHKGLAVEPGQTVKTGKGAEAIYVIGTNAFLQRESSKVHFGTDALTEFMRVVTGRVLSVFGSGRKSLRVPNATIGIRGTACHIGVEPERTYLCLCYGEVEVMLNTPGKEPIQLKSRHHDMPIYIPSRGENIQPTKMLDHNDDELKLLEALVGRRPPFMKS